MPRNRTATLVACILLAPWMAGAQQLQPPPTPPEGGWYWHGPGTMMGSGGWSFWWIFPLLMFVGMIACAVLMLRAWRSGAGTMPCAPGHGGHRRSAASGDAASALRILDERFARGEVQRAEYEEKREVLLRRGVEPPA